ncbi:MAG: TlpA disulfide reductase family protein [Methylococcales bacterium]|nr:TlpA disulfide reductase family protein [Methylococcales bacterium]
MPSKTNLKLIAILLFILFANKADATDINLIAPQCNLISLNDAKNINLQQFKGKVIYVDFWASWCGPCATSFPFMNNLSRDLKAQGLEVIGVNLDENLEESKQFLEQQPANFIIASDPEQQCAKQFGLKAMPSSYLIDRKGLVRHVHIGFRPAEALEFRALAEKLLAEPIDNSK